MSTSSGTPIPGSADPDLAGHAQSVGAIRAMLDLARGLNARTDPLLAGQVEGVVGRLTALLAALGETLPAGLDAAAPAPVTPSLRLDGQVAIVTGGGGGLGTLGACAFAEAGADVVVVARTLAKCEATAAEVRARGRRALALSVDVTDAAQVGQMVAATLAAFGRVDILFNCAGITSPLAFDAGSVDDWWKVVDTNLRGTVLCTRAVLPHMKARRAGRIINMGSILSKVGIANRSAYTASKSAIAHLGQTLAFELGPHGITVNAIGPNVTVTDLNRELIKQQPELYGPLLQRIPLGRLGQPEDLAGALVFLASPAAAFITGQTLYIDGGYTAG